MAPNHTVVDIRALILSDCQNSLEEKMIGLKQDLNVIKTQGGTINLSETDINDLFLLRKGKSWMNDQQKNDFIDYLGEILLITEGSSVLCFGYNEINQILLEDESAASMMLFKILCHYVEDHKVVDYLLSNNIMFSNITQAIGSKHLGVVRLHSELFVKISKLYQKDIIFQNQSIEDLLKASSINKFRVYDLAVKICEEEPSLVNVAIDNTVLLNSLISEMQSNDILVQLNCIEILSRFSIIPNKAAMNFLEDNQIIASFEKTIMNILNGDLLLRPLLPGIIKCFGLATTSNLDRLPAYPSFINALFSIIHEKEMNTISIAFETLCLITSSDDGLQFLYNRSDNQLSDNFRIAGECIKDISDENVRCRLIDALSITFNRKTSDNSKLKDTVLREMYTAIDREPMKMMLSLARQPFLRIKLSALALISSLMKYDWAVEDSIDCAGFIEFLLDRNLEKDRPCKEIKYNVVCAMANSTMAKLRLNPEHVDAIMNYVNKGPFHITSQAAVHYEANE